jgi:hypothetical protein
MLHWYWRYIPCKGVKLDFDEIALYSNADFSILHLQRRNPKQRLKIKKKHIQEDFDGTFKGVNDIDFEIALRSIGGDGNFVLDPVHVFSFLLMIRTRGWINAPTILTSSVLEEPEIDGPHIFCSSFLDSTPTHYRDITLTLEDANWIKKHMDIGIRFTSEPMFQNAMQALTSFHCVPYENVCLLLAWSGLEALFKTNQEISFRLSLYISNFLKKGPERVEIFERLKRSYDVRSRITHGSGGRLNDIHEYADYTRDILRACLAKCIDAGTFPDTKNLMFGE